MLGAQYCSVAPLANQDYVPAFLISTFYLDATHPAVWQLQLIIDHLHWPNAPDLERWCSIQR